jgi:hypothetical protein
MLAALKEAVENGTVTACRTGVEVVETGHTRCNG